MNWYKHIAVWVLVVLTSNIYAQNFIGMHKNEIKEVMKKQYTTSKLNTNVVNKEYNYLKYEDKINEITTLFFLSDEDKCTMVRKMCDYSNINEELDKLNSKYQKAGKNKWTFADKGKKYQVVLEEGEWYFTITTKLNK